MKSRIHRPDFRGSEMSLDRIVAACWSNPLSFDRSIAQVGNPQSANSKIRKSEKFVDPQFVNPQDPQIGKIRKSARSANPQMHKSCKSGDREMREVLNPQISKSIPQSKNQSPNPITRSNPQIRKSQT